MSKDEASQMTLKRFIEEDTTTDDTDNPPFVDGKIAGFPGRTLGMILFSTISNTQR
jgi:hypothetical protein